MPKNFFDLKTEFSDYTSVLVVDKLGELSTVLVDTLLSRGFLVNYLGVESKESFEYLLDRKNFNYLEDNDGIKSLPKPDYIFCFLDEIKSFPRDLFLSLKQDGAKVVICLPLGEKHRTEDPEWLDKSLNFRLVFFDTLFGPRLKSRFWGKLFSVREQLKNAFLKQDFPAKIYPVSAEGFVGELIQLMFLPNTKGKTFLIRGEETGSESFIRILQNFYPGFNVDLDKEERFLRDPEGVKVVEVKENLEEKIGETARWFKRYQEDSFVAEDKEESVKENHRPCRRSRFLKKLLFGLSLFSGLFLLFFVLPLLLSLVSGYSAVYRLGQLERAIEQGNFSLAMKKTKSAGKHFNISRKTLNLFGPFYTLVGLGNATEEVYRVFVFGENLNASVRLALQVGREISSQVELFLKGESVNWPEELSPARVNLALAYEQASLAQTNLGKLGLGFEFLRQKPNYEKLKILLPKSREMLLKAQNLLAILPEILGSGGRKTYLVLFQNNMELRPTGGFIGSYGLVSLENGRLVNFEIFDVYQADGQLKGHVEPPAKLREYLGEATWYLRDSNWDPDFAVSAQRAQWFLDKEMQVSVDGTLGVTLEAARKVLAALGEVEISEYQEKINKDNLFQKAEYYVELGTFPGSTQKKDFLGSLSTALLERIKAASEKELAGVARALFESLEEKEIMIYFSDPQTEGLITGLGWDGRIRDYRQKKTDPILVDFLHLNEANVGINKANFFVKRKIDHQVVLSAEGKIEETLTVDYENQSPSDSWPAGRYRTYVRLFLPKGAKIISVLVTKKENSEYWLPLESRYLDVSREHDRSVFGFLMEVPIQSRRKIEIKYELAEIFEIAQKPGTYLLMFQKQSGAYPSDYTLTFVYPPGLVPVRVIPAAVAGEGRLLVTSKLNKDRVFQVDLAR